MVGWSTAAYASQALTDARKAVLIDLLEQDCGSCHGLTMKGGLGPPLTPEVLRDRSVEDLAETIAEGRSDLAMPPWKYLLTPNEIRWLAERLKQGGAP